MKSFKLRKIGNHWYPCIDHELGDPINLTEKVDRYLNILDLSKSGEITVELEELGILFGGINIIYFNEEDIVRYLTSDVYWLLENQFNFNFHKTSYKIHIY